MASRFLLLLCCVAHAVSPNLTWKGERLGLMPLLHVELPDAHFKKHSVDAKSLCNSSTAPNSRSTRIGDALREDRGADGEF